MLELYHSEPNTFFLKPLIALHEKQRRFESRWFDADAARAIRARPFPARSKRTCTWNAKVRC